MKLRALLLIIILLLLPLSAAAQGCVMCKTVTAGLSTQAATRLNLAIIIMLLPAVSGFLLLMRLLYRYRNASNNQHENQLRGNRLDSNRH